MDTQRTKYYLVISLIKIGIVGFDTSHAVEFTKRINHTGITEDHWVYGGKVVIGYPGERSNFVSDEVIMERTQTIRGFGVEIVDRAEDMIGKIDAVMIEFQDGNLHLPYAKPFLEAGIPTFIDKPFTCSLSDAREIAKIAKENRTPLFSASSLRYALEVQDVKNRKDLGRILGASTFSPAHIHPDNPGLFNYGIHGVETLYALMGSGCISVRCFSYDDWDLVVGKWDDGRIGVFRGLRRGSLKYGFTAFCEGGIIPIVIDPRYIYRELLKRVLEMFKTGREPIPIEETIEIIAFIEASLKSAEKDSKEQKLEI